MSRQVKFGWQMFSASVQSVAITLRAGSRLPWAKCLKPSTILHEGFYIYFEEILLEEYVTYIIKDLKSHIF